MADIGRRRWRVAGRCACRRTRRRACGGTRARQRGGRPGPGQAGRGGHTKPRPDSRRPASVLLRRGSRGRLLLDTDADGFEVTLALLLIAAGLLDRTEHPVWDWLSLCYRYFVTVNGTLLITAVGRGRSVVRPSSSQAPAATAGAAGWPTIHASSAAATPTGPAQARTRRSALATTSPRRPARGRPPGSRRCRSPRAVACSAAGGVGVAAAGSGPAAGAVGNAWTSSWPPTPGHAFTRGGTDGS